MIRVAEVQEILGVGKSTVLALYRKKEIEGQHQGERRPLSKENRQLNYWSIQSNIALSGGVYIHGKR